MPTAPSPAQSEASRLNGAKSSGPASDAGKARSALNGVRHGLSGRTFFLLPDEDPAEFRAHEAMWLAEWSPRDLHEHEAAAAAIRAMWREIRADRLEAQVLTDLFAAGKIADEAERQAAKAAGLKALGTLLRYRGRIEREHRQAMDALDALRQRRLSGPIARATTRTRAAACGTPGRWPARCRHRHAGDVCRPLACPVNRARSRAAERTRAPPQPPPAPGTGRHGPPRCVKLAARYTSHRVAARARVRQHPGGWPKRRSSSRAAPQG